MRLVHVVHSSSSFEFSPENMSRWNNKHLLPPLFHNRRGEKVSFSQRTTVCDGRRRHRHAGDSVDTKGVQIGKSYPGIASPPPPRHKSLARIGMNALPFSRLTPFNSSSSHHWLGWMLFSSTVPIPPYFPQIISRSGASAVWGRKLIILAVTHQQKTSNFPQTQIRSNLLWKNSK